MLYKNYKTDPSKETDGVWVDFAEGVRVKIARAGGTNHQYLKSVERETKPYRRAIQNGSISVDVADTIIKKVYAETIILGWENVTDENGKPLKFTKEACLKVLTDLPEFFAEVKMIAESMEMFRDAALESEAKN